MARTAAKTTPAPVTTPVTGSRFDAQTLGRIKGAIAWRPNPGDTINGTIVVITPRESPFGGKYPCVILDTGADQLVAIHAFHGVLLNELKEMKAAPGLNIAIHYGGKREHNTALDGDGNKRKYHGYSVVPADGAELETWDFTADTATTDEETIPY